MSLKPSELTRATTLSRRAALLAPLMLSGCSWFDGWFGDKKSLLPGKRESVFTDRRGLVVDEGVAKVVLPPAASNAGWPQAGGNPAHLMGHLAANDHLTQAWATTIGEGGGYRRILMAQPVVLNGTVVFTMDSNARGFGLHSRLMVGVCGASDTKPRGDDENANVGGGLGVDGSTLYAVNGLSQLVRASMLPMEKNRWRRRSWAYQGVLHQ